MDDVIIIGAGIVGTAAAVFLAEAGAQVTILEAEQIAAAASGRNAGSIQHPLDDVRAPLYAESVEHYRRWGVIEGEPTGLLAVTEGPEAADAVVLAARDYPELEPVRLDGAELVALEPALAPGLCGTLLRTGYAVGPAAATHRVAAAARALGVTIEEGVAAEPAIEADRVVGARTADGLRPAGAVLVAAGAWSSPLLDPTGSWQPVRPLWGVTVELRHHVRHRLEEWAGAEDESPGAGFEATPLGATCVLGATRSLDPPDVEATAAEVLARAARFLPAAAEARVMATRACPRPVSADGVPILGPVPGVDGLHVATGHGPYGITLGPASGRIAADTLLEREPVREEYSAARLVQDVGTDRPLRRSIHG